MVTEAEWVSIFDRWSKSGVSQTDFCKMEGLSYPQFCIWRSKLLQMGVLTSKQPVGLRNHWGQVEKSGFVPLILENETKKIDVPKSANRIEIQLPYGIVLSIPA